MSLEASSHYLRLIEHDREVLRLLTEQPSPALDTSDWQITIFYYILCLYMKALGSVGGLEFQDHYAIKQWLNSTPELVVIAKPYRKAEEWSRDARYEGRLFNDSERTRFLNWFTIVRAHLTQLLRSAGVTNLPQIELIFPS